MRSPCECRFFGQVQRRVGRVQVARAGRTVGDPGHDGLAHRRGPRPAVPGLGAGPGHLAAPLLTYRAQVRVVLKQRPAIRRRSFL